MDLIPRMERFEATSAFRLQIKTPVIIRTDGKGFSKALRRFKTFDEDILDAMESAAQGLMQCFQGASLGYVASDEISICLLDTQSLEAQAAYDNNVQKISSVAASTSSTIFNMKMVEFVEQHGFIFDGRCFNIPMEEVANYFVYRQRSYMGNSKTKFARQYFSAKKLQGVSADAAIEQCLPLKHDWYELRDEFRTGTFFTKDLRKISTTLPYESIMKLL